MSSASQAADAATDQEMQDLPHAARFVHLRVQSSYSLLESTLQLNDIVRACEAYGMPAVAICDRNNMFGALEIAEKFAQRGIQPIIGVTLALQDVSADAPPDRAGSSGQSGAFGAHARGLSIAFAAGEPGASGPSR